MRDYLPETDSDMLEHSIVPPRSVGAAAAIRQHMTDRELSVLSSLDWDITMMHVLDQLEHLFIHLDSQPMTHLCDDADRLRALSLALCTT